jgi:hypothetical protein
MEGELGNPRGCSISDCPSATSMALASLASRPALSAWCSRDTGTESVSRLHTESPVYASCVTGLAGCVTCVDTHDNYRDAMQKFRSCISTAWPGVHGWRVGVISPVNKLIYRTGRREIQAQPKHKAQPGKKAQPEASRRFYAVELPRGSRQERGRMSSQRSLAMSTANSITTNTLGCSETSGTRPRPQSTTHRKSPGYKC